MQGSAQLLSERISPFASQVYPQNNSNSSQIGDDQVNMASSRQGALATIAYAQPVMSWLLNTTANLHTLVVRVPVFVSESTHHSALP